jgi:hypothetical protein
MAVTNAARRRLLQLYVERFHQRIGNGVRELIAAYAQLRVADKLEEITEFVNSTVGSWRSGRRLNPDSESHTATDDPVRWPDGLNGLSTPRQEPPSGIFERHVAMAGGRRRDTPLPSRRRQRRGPQR